MKFYNLIYLKVNTLAQTQLTVTIAAQQNLIWQETTTPQIVSTSSKNNLKLSFGNVTATSNTPWEIKAKSNNLSQLKNGSKTIPYTFSIQGGELSQRLDATDQTVYDGGNDTSKGIANKEVYLNISAQDTIGKNSGSYTDTITLTIISKT